MGEKKRQKWRDKQDLKRPWRVGSHRLHLAPDSPSECGATISKTPTFSDGASTWMINYISTLHIGHCKDLDFKARA